MARRTATATGPRRRSERGVTLVELLVTIVVTVLFFAALVPVFVLAQKTGSGDRARLMAVNVAQSRIELVRDLPYQQVTSSFLNSGTEQALGAGIDTEWTSDGGKTFTIVYEVDRVFQQRDDSGDWVFEPYPDDDESAPTGVEAYKMVTVDVVWQGPPSPTRHSVLKTAIYRQFAGSEITRLTVSPLTTLPSNRIGIMTETGPVTLKVDISSYDWSRTRSVTFTVQGPNGLTVASEKIDVHPDDPDADPVVSWDWTWTAETRPTDGLYTFTAVAMNDKGEVGNAWRLWYPLETGPPPPPTNLTVIRGRNTVILRWERPEANDLTGYDVDRHLVQADGTLGDPPSTWSELPIWTLALTSANEEYPGVLVDRSVSPDESYQYVVRARDLGLVPSDDSSPAGAAALDADSDLRTDLTPPPAPRSVSLVRDGQAVTVSWTAPTSTTDVEYYCVYRDDAWDAPLACVAKSESLRIVDKRAGWNTTHTYSVRSMDKALNESAPVPQSITVPLAPVGQKFDLTVEVSGYSAQVTVESLADYLAYPLSSTGNAQNQQYIAFLNANQKKTFKDLPYGMWRVRVAFEGPSSIPLERRLVVQDIELYQDTHLEYTAPTN